MKQLHVLTLAVSSALLALCVAASAGPEATCPVSGKTFTPNEKTVTLMVNGQKEQFCCGNCPAAFVKNPAKYMKADLTCPVMTSNKVDLTKAPRTAVNDNMFFTCCGGCPGQIVSNPSKYMKELRDPVSGKSFTVSGNPPHSEYKGVHYFFASEENKKTFEAEPDKYANKLLSKAD